MVSFKLVYVGKRFLYQGAVVRAVGETDSGSVKLESGEWVSYIDLIPLDGTTKGFKVFPLPKAA